MIKPYHLNTDALAYTHAHLSPHTHTHSVTLLCHCQQ